MTSVIDGDLIHADIPILLVALTFLHLLGDRGRVCNIEKYPHP